MTDDIDQFQRVVKYESGGKNLVDIEWFHAYNWLIALLPLLFHWSVPSHMVPRAWDRTGEFRAFILWVILLHAVVLALIAMLLRQLCGSRAVCFGALLLFMTTPTFMTYVDLLDSRYLGCIVGVPAILILLAKYESLSRKTSLSQLAYGFALPGFLLGVSQSIHYTIIYFAVPLMAVFWTYVAARIGFAAFTKFLAFAGGVAAWFVPVEILSLVFHPFSQSMLGIMLQQVSAHNSRYTPLSDQVEWLRFFLSEMGIPMMIAVVAGGIIVASKKMRPPYINAFHANLIVYSCLLGFCYVLASPSLPLYRQLGFHQIFYALLALIAIDTCVRAIPAGRGAKLGLASALFLLIAATPSLERMPEVFDSAQGLGRAVNAAHALTGEDHVFFIEYYDNDVNRHSIVTREDVSKLDNDDYIVTFYPMKFIAKYPDLFAAFHDARPVASFPTLWCTVETWVEQRAYWSYRRTFDEPESCNAQVYSAAAIHREEGGRPLAVAAVRADSELSAEFAPYQVFALHQSPGQLWVSQPTVGPHWLEITFARAAILSSMTVVPPDYLMPPESLLVGRPLSTTILASQTDEGPMHQLWSNGDLRDNAIYTATFAPTLVKTLRLVITQPAPSLTEHSIVLEQRLPASSSAGIEYIHFPGFVVMLPKRLQGSS